MSYILDALQRAQSQREQGAVPGLHTPAAAPLSARPRPTQTRWAIVATLLAAAAVLLYALWPQPTPTPTSVPAPAPAITIPPAPMPEPVASNRDMSTRPAATKAPATAAPPARTPPPLAPASSAPLPTMAELPEEVRRLIPPLAITGAVQTQDPRNSLLLVNGQVLSPGAELAGDVVLESVAAHSAVLRMGSTRFRVTF